MSSPGLFHFSAPLQHPAWDEMVLANPGGTFFHSVAWAKVLQTTYGYAPHYLCHKIRSGLSPVLPVMEVDSRWTGRRGVSLPFTDECLPLLTEERDFSEAFQEIMALGRRRGWKYFEGRGGDGQVRGVTPSISFYRHTVDLRKKEDALFSGLDDATRRAVRKAEKRGVQLEQTQSLEAVRIFYALHEKTRRKHGLPPQPFTFFQSIQEHVLSRNLGFVLLARFEKVPIGGAVFFHFGRKAIYKFGASDADFLHLRGNNLIMWEAIRRYAREGFSELSLGRTELAHAGLRRFKQGWGGAEETLNYYRFDFQKNQFVTLPDRVQGWHNGLFRMMPLPASRCMGELLYRHMG